MDACACACLGRGPSKIILPAPRSIFACCSCAYCSGVSYVISFVDDVKSVLPLVVVAVVYSYGKEQYSTVLLHINDTIIR